MARSYLDLTKDEREHALALHKESIVIDSSVVAVIDYVAENMWLDDVLKGGLTATNLTVCMQRSFTEALKEVMEHNHWAERNGDRVIVVRKAADIERAFDLDEQLARGRGPGIDPVGRSGRRENRLCRREELCRWIHSPCAWRWVR